MASNMDVKDPFRLTVRRMHSPRPDYSDIGTVKDEQTFYLHKALAIYHSDYFRATFNDDRFIEGATGELVLRDIDHDTFAFFVDWLYKGNVSDMQTLDSSTENAGLLSVSSYCFADRFLVPKMKSDVLEQAFSYFHNWALAGHEEISYAFGNLPNNNSFLQFLVDVVCNDWAQLYSLEEAEYEKVFKRLPYPFVYRAMKKNGETGRTSIRSIQKFEPGRLVAH